MAYKLSAGTQVASSDTDLLEVSQDQGGGVFATKVVVRSEVRAYNQILPINDLGNLTGAEALDWTLGVQHKGVLTGNTTFTFTDPVTVAGEGIGLQVDLTQDATGGRDIIWPASVKWPGGEPTWTSMTASQRVLVSMWYNDTDYVAEATSFF